MNQPAPVLYVEDTEDDVFLMRRAFTKAALARSLIVARNGREAIQLLENFIGQPSVHPQMPCLIVLDVKMPFIGGDEILKWIRQHAEFRAVPVIMFSSSSQARDVRDARESGANAYVVKPTNLDDLRSFVEALGPICDAPHAVQGWLKLPGSID